MGEAKKRGNQDERIAQLKRDAFLEKSVMAFFFIGLPVCLVGLGWAIAKYAGLVGTGILLATGGMLSFIAVPLVYYFFDIQHPAIEKMSVYKNRQWRNDGMDSEIDYTYKHMDLKFRATLMDTLNK